MADLHKHSAWRYNDGPGRNCPGCRAAANADHRGRVADRKANPRDYVEHGKYSTYSNHGCRCGPCRKANAEYRADRRRGGKN